MDAKNPKMDDSGRQREARYPQSWISRVSVALTVLLLASLLPYQWSVFNLSTVFGPRAAQWVSHHELTSPKVEITVQSFPCSGHGDLESEYETGDQACRCHPCFTGEDCSMPDSTCMIDLNQGDPKIFEEYWMQSGDASITTILGWQRLSYYADSKQFFFVQKDLDQVIRAVHVLVGNAVTEGRHIVIGTGSTQLFQAALYALSSPSPSTPTRVVSLAPYYSAYPAVTDFLKSALYTWGGDAAEFEKEGQQDPYIELVTTPNNPTGEVRHPVINGTGAVVHDLAYYWPHFTPITSPADEDVMLFTLSKSTGHAGTRIGWAIVKDLMVAQKMAKFVELNTIGVSKDAQMRATQILRSVTKESRGGGKSSRQVQDHEEDHVQVGAPQVESLFHFGSSEMAYRWMRLRSALEGSVHFKLPNFSPAFCTFLGKTGTPTPAFAWLQCTQQDDCEKFLKEQSILTRGGDYFGADPTFVRLSMLDRRGSFEVLIGRLEALEIEGI